jgi:CheY-like chemotaxis protein
MSISANSVTEDFDPRFKIFHELMPYKIKHILLISTPYDAWIMEADCRLSEKIINEYRGLNLSHPPRLSWASSSEEALALIHRETFDLVITMPGPTGMDMVTLGRQIKREAPQLPVIMLTHGYMQSPDESMDTARARSCDRTFIWAGNTDILVALIKSVEDRLNVAHDTDCAGIRVVLMIEDSPFYLSSILPILYKEIVTQTQNLIGEGLNEEHRLLTMRARPKILIADNYEDAMAIYNRYKSCILGVISDVRYPRNGRLDDNAGQDLLRYIRSDRWDIPSLLTSSDPANVVKAEAVSSRFIDKNSPKLQAEVRSFVTNKLGFGDFKFRTPGGELIGRATNLRSMERLLPQVPEESFLMHWNRNDFSRWMFARSEIMLGSKLRPATSEDFSHDTASMKQYLIENIIKMRRRKLTGTIINFDPMDFDYDAPFFKIGNGSLGGKARGLAFMSTLLHVNADFKSKYGEVDIFVPQSLVITTEVFEDFIDINGLGDFAVADSSDDDVAQAFIRSDLPQWVMQQLRAFLADIRYPLAVRSSSLLEDDQFKSYAGLYRTHMLSNNHPDTDVRLAQLATAIKSVYASTYYRDPKKFALRVGHRTEEEKMAIIIQRVVGQPFNDFFYPTLSGVAQSHNYYPFSKMKPEEGIVTIAMGLGRLVMEGEAGLRFSPAHPRILPQFAKVEDVLDNAQKTFYALNMAGKDISSRIEDDVAVVRRSVGDAVEESPMSLLCGTYNPDEHRIRDSFHHQGVKVPTFASILKHDLFPLPLLMQEIMNIGQVGMGCPVEIEFSLNIFPDRNQTPQLAILQLRPMTEVAHKMSDGIDDELIARSFCFSTQSLGGSDRNDIQDVIYVRPETFEPSRTTQIATEIGRINSRLTATGRRYLLVGPGRWGSADTWLGIPVRWADISGVAAIIETWSDKLKAEPSQGSHFFHNIIALGINYITVREHGDDFLHWNALTCLPKIDQTEFVVHARATEPLALKVDSHNSSTVVWTEPN